MSDAPVEGSGPAASWPSQQQTASRSRPARSDGRRSRSRLLHAAADLLAAETPFTLADVAAAADVSTATAYRHFRSAEDLAQAFIAGFLDDVEHRVSTRDRADPNPEAELRELCVIWVDSVLEWGPALAHLRSAEGFLSRRAREEPEMLRSLRHLEPTMREILAAQLGCAPASVDESDLAYALSVWNALADPREVLDQTQTLAWSSERISTRLHQAVMAVVGDLPAQG